MRLFDAGARGPGTAVVHDRVLTVANGITVLRLLGLPLFAWLVLGVGAYGRAFVLLALVAATDWVDGYVARRFDQVTRLGRVLDPLIDRALLATAGVTLLVAGILPWWVVVAVVSRDVLILCGALLALRRAPTPPVSRLGKFATASLLIGIPGFLLGAMDWLLAAAFAVAAWAFTLVGIVAYWVAGAHYARAVGIARRLRSGG